MTRFALPLLALVLLSGCSKVAVFEPETVAGRLNYNERLAAPVAAQNPQGATLKNGAVILDDNGRTPRLPAGFTLLGADGLWLCAADENGALLIIGPEGNERRLNLSERILSAATDGQVAAVTTRGNAHRLIDIQSGESLFFTQEKTVLAVSVRMARPLLGRDQAVFPTLDGKLLIVDRARNQVVREQVVGTETFFANLIFLGEHEGSVIAASQNRVIALSRDGGFYTLERDVRLLTPLKSGLYLFSLDGTVSRISGKLETLQSVKLPYARIVAATETAAALYAVEQSGWIIRLSDNLTQSAVYELPDDIRAPLFAAREKLYYGRKAVLWP